MTATPPDDTHPHDDPVISPDRDHRGMLIAIMLEWLIAIVGIRTPTPRAQTSRAYAGPDPTAFDGGILTSGRRTVAGNKAVGGARSSNHLSGNAVDYAPRPGETLAQLRERLSEYLGPTARVGIHNGNHAHADLPGYGQVPLFGKNGTRGATTSGPPVGTTVGDYSFRGGNPNDRNNWTKAR